MVNDLNKSFAFYVDLLGMTPISKWHTGTYLSSAELWFCLSCDEVYPAKEYSHIAFGVSVINLPVIKASQCPGLEAK